MIKSFLQLTKPGIIIGNLIAAAAGFFLAAQGNIDWFLFLAMCSGVILIIASGCVFNNYIDRDIDGLMQRTCNRVLVKKLISLNSALVYAFILGLAGFTVLFVFTNITSLFFGALGFIVYVGFYSLYFKRKSIYGTLVGSLSGACPPVIGYCAITGNFDIGAAIILIAFCLWQIPHSYAIAIYRMTDYQAAKIPVLPVCKDIKTARMHIIAYITAFTLVSLLLSQQAYVGIIYAVVMSILGAYWLYIAIADFNRLSNQMWAKRLFVFSILTITILSVLISFDFNVNTLNLMVMR
ncbi:MULTISPECIES: heme o synthase [unclassified Pseudoalteromonas]|uniref:heme o synthase n=1 Tax=unclassified Pseudoalteromonas TaxID=194690 RepID=UPI0005A67827|nr:MULTISPECIES: heme o synthase [unclassified Pseudoalteromonas]